MQHRSVTPAVGGRSYIYIVTKKNVVINAIVYLDDNNVIKYKKTSMSDSPFFMMDREHIQDVFYKDR